MFLNPAADDAVLHAQEVLNDQLEAAIKAKQSARVIDLLAQGANPEARSLSGELLFVQALIADDHLDMAPAFLGAGGRFATRTQAYSKCRPNHPFWVCGATENENVWGPEYDTFVDSVLMARLHQYRDAIKPLEARAHAATLARLRMDLPQPHVGPDTDAHTLTDRATALRRVVQILRDGMTPPSNRSAPKATLSG